MQFILTDLTRVAAADVAARLIENHCSAQYIFATIYDENGTQIDGCTISADDSYTLASALRTFNDTSSSFGRETPSLARSATLEIYEAGLTGFVLTFDIG